MAGSKPLHLSYLENIILRNRGCWGRRMMPSVLNSVKYCSLDKYQHTLDSYSVSRDSSVTSWVCLECVCLYLKLSGNWYFLQWGMNQGIMTPGSGCHEIAPHCPMPPGLWFQLLTSLLANTTHITSRGMRLRTDRGSWKWFCLFHPDIDLVQVCQNLFQVKIDFDSDGWWLMRGNNKY